jgi:hypothetical protein
LTVVNVSTDGSAYAGHVQMPVRREDPIRLGATCTALAILAGSPALAQVNDASQFGIGIVAARIAEMVLRDERAVVPIGSYHDKFGVTLSLPSIVGKGGIVPSFEPEMSREEAQALMLGAANLRKAAGRN